MVDEEPAAAIDAADIAETAVLQQPLALAAADGPAVVEAGADCYVDLQGLGRDRRNNRRTKADCETKSQQCSFHVIVLALQNLSIPVEVGSWMAKLPAPYRLGCWSVMSRCIWSTDPGFAIDAIAPRTARCGFSDAPCQRRQGAR